MYNDDDDETPAPSFDATVDGKYDTSSSEKLHAHLPLPIGISRINKHP